jgi:pilus assembly protein CpaE
MHVELIAASHERQAYLDSLFQPLDGMAWSSRVRHPGPGWPRHVPLDTVDMLVLDSPVNAQQQDLAVLSEWIARHPSLGVLQLTDDNDPGFLLQAMRAGVREVLGQRPDAVEVMEALHRLQRHVQSFQMQAQETRPPSGTPGRLVAFLPCKGGGGATFIATNLAYLLAQDYQHDTVLADLDLHNADASYYLSNDEHRNSWLDLTRHLERLDPHLFHSSLHPVIPHLFLLAAPQVGELPAEITPLQLEHVLQLARREDSTVLLDLPPRLDAIALKALELADEVYLVLDNTVPQVRDAKRCLTLLRTLNHAQDKLRLILNRRHPGSDVTPEHIQNTLGLKISHQLPPDAVTALQAINQGVPLMNLNANSPLVLALHELIQQAWHLSPPKRKSWLDRWF